jgi:hypothetical protein
MDVKIRLALRGMYEAIVPPADRQQELPPTHKYNALYIIMHHIHPDLKSEYVPKEEPSVLWTALQSSCLRQIMIVFTYACKIMNLLKIIIMSFIRFVLNYGFVRKNLLIRIRLIKLSLLCSHQIGS